MRALSQLLHSPKDLDFLQTRGVFVELETFLSELKPVTLCSTLRPLETSEDTPKRQLVWAGQQLYVDYRCSVVSKLLLLDALNHQPGVTPFFVGADTDRSGSDKAITTIQWPLPDAVGNIRVAAPRAAKHTETRFVMSAFAQRQEAMRKLEIYLRQTVENFQSVASRFERLKQIFLDETEMTLATLNAKITRLLMDHLRLRLPLFFLSSFLEDGCLTASLNQWLRHRDACIAAFNEAIDELRRYDINPVVKPLPEDYLPLNYSCPEDNSRCRLSYERQGNEHFAVGKNRAGKVYRFSLGQGELSLDELDQTGRWSPDVCFPVFLNRHVSGCVVGKSSALYGLVMNRVLERGLGERPVPMIIPDLVEEIEIPSHESVLFDYLTQTTH